MVGYAIGHAAGESKGFINLFDLSQSTSMKVNKFWHELGNKFFGSDTDKNKVINLTDHTPEILAKKNKTLSAK
ncbi:hypothetical protein FD31_GL000988 [Companilactobacillus nantensis DSM 16982]|uniref:Uncharacterized protein n=1 Tax=Companilactobacillus nantensis DSM 16982 TaxID=1423774 RepID=A0A0R1WRS9_9LACO|nr:hypothetical protein FD31_GL000988 [Companilactobacillus nantensis DSM 16982]